MYELSWVTVSTPGTAIRFFTALSTVSSRVTEGFILILSARRSVDYPGVRHGKPFSKGELATRFRERTPANLAARESWKHPVLTLLSILTRRAAADKNSPGWRNMRSSGDTFASDQLKFEFRLPRESIERNETNAGSGDFPSRCAYSGRFIFKNLVVLDSLDCLLP
jgi:hypothetical protein